LKNEFSVLVTRVAPPPALPEPSPASPNCNEALPNVPKP
jgi:hypothetical protein